MGTNESLLVLKQSKLNINQLNCIEAFLKALDVAKSKSEVTILMHNLKHHKTDDDAVIGLKLFLENHNWIYDESKKSIKSSLDNLKSIKDNNIKYRLNYTPGRNQTE